MFKRGDIVQAPSGVAVFLDTNTVYNNGVTYIYLDGREDHDVCDGVNLYIGPIYERDGQRFVPSGEPCRIPECGEWFFNESTQEPRQADSSWGGRQSHSDHTGHGWTRRILLPVPSLEPECEPEPCICCHGVGKVTCECHRCGGTGNEGV